MKTTHTYILTKNTAIQGGDWGSTISRVMARLYPQHTKAIHLNFCPVAPPLPWKNPLSFVQSLLTTPFSAKERSYLSTTYQYFTEGSAYMRQQQTRPQTLGYALHDSPVALLAWIYEKQHEWTDDYPWTDEEILTWVSIYQFSKAGPAASVRIYHEAFRKPGPGDVTMSELAVDRLPASVRVAVVHFKRELLKMPWSWYRVHASVVREREYEKGGHFAAWEVPELLADDVREFLGKQGEAYGAVTGKDGY